jgi:hypothetical protein
MTAGCTFLLATQETMIGTGYMRDGMPMIAIQVMMRWVQEENSMCGNNLK